MKLGRSPKFQLKNASRSRDIIFEQRSAEIARGLGAMRRKYIQIENKLEKIQVEGLLVTNGFL